MLFGLLDPERLIHSTKTAMACAIAFVVTKLIGLSGSQWIVITTIVVMCAQIYVGSVMQKAYLRFLGTLLGCIFALIVLFTVGDTDLATGTTIILSSFIFSYVATQQESMAYAGTLGAVTTAIVLLSPNPTLFLAAERFLEISIGILIATLISQFFLPIHARTHLRRTQAMTIKELSIYYNACLVTHRADINTQYFQELDESIIKTLTKQRQLAKEANREPLGSFYDPLVFMQSLQHEKEILRAIDLMHLAYNKIVADYPDFAALPTLKALNAGVDDAFNTIIKLIETEQFTAPASMLNDALQKLNDAVTALPDISKENRTYQNGFLFAAEILTNHLTALSHLCSMRVLKA